MIQEYADFMFQTGQLDENQRDFFKEQCGLCGKMIEEKKWIEAFKVGIDAQLFAFYIFEL